MSKQERALRYFRLADQYFETAKLLLETLIQNDNSNVGLGNSDEEAYAQMVKNSTKSDLYLFIPAIFNCLQSTELFVKGVILLNNTEIDSKHEIQKSLEIIKQIYSESAPIYKEFKKMYCSQEEVLKQFKKDNNITNSHDLYVALRYPEKNDENHSEYTFYSLMYNGDKGINLFKRILQNISAIKTEVLKEYNRFYD